MSGRVLETKGIFWQVYCMICSYRKPLPIMKISECQKRMKALFSTQIGLRGALLKKGS